MQKIMAPNNKAKRKTAIVTGFEPFGPYEFNPTMDLANRVNQASISGYQVKGIVLPCTYYGAFDKLKDEIEVTNPDVIISTGLSSSVQGVRLEMTGQNIMDGKYADAEGFSPTDEPIIEGNRFIRFPNETALGEEFYGFVNKGLKGNDIPFEYSVNADSFVCNSLIYQAVDYIKTNKLQIGYVFCHFPWTSDYLDKIDLESEKITLPSETLDKTIELLLAAAGKVQKPISWSK